MATLYVDARSGNDTASGTTWAAALKTLGAAVTAATTGSTINCVGVFNESVAVTSEKHLTFNASGYAVLDGTLSITTGIVATSAAGGSLSDTTPAFVGFIIRNYTNGVTVTRGSSSCNLTLTGCVVESCSYGIKTLGGSSYSSITATNTLIRNCSVYGYYSESGGISTFTNCTFTGNAYGAYCQTNGGDTIRKCVFHSNGTYHLRVVADSYYSSNSNYNVFDLTSGAKIRIGSSDYTTIATWKAAFTGGKDANSISADPQFLDSAKGLYRLKSTSPAVIGGVIIGAYNTKLAYGISNNLNTSLWTGATVTPGSGAALDGSNNWTLASGTSATVEFETADWGVLRNVRRINLQHVYAGLGSGVGGGPTSILDYDKADTLPETWQYRVAISTDGSTYGAYATKNLYDDININARRLKIEVTLRNDA